MILRKLLFLPHQKRTHNLGYYPGVGVVTKVTSAFVGDVVSVVVVVLIVKCC